jgi:hypothetical protein
MLCAKRTRGSEIIFDALMELLGDVGHVEFCFSSFRDGVSVLVNRRMVCAKRTIGLEIILDAHDGPPR